MNASKRVCDGERDSERKETRLRKLKEMYTVIEVYYDRGTRVAPYAAACSIT